MKKTLIVSLSAAIASLCAENRAPLTPEQTPKAIVEKDVWSKELNDEVAVNENASTSAPFGESDLADLTMSSDANNGASKIAVVDESKTAAVDESKTAAVDESKTAAVDESKTPTENTTNATAGQEAMDKTLQSSDKDKTVKFDQMITLIPPDLRDEQKWPSGQEQGNDLAEPTGNPSPQPMKERADDDQVTQLAQKDAPSDKSALSRIKNWFNWF